MTTLLVSRLGAKCSISPGTEEVRGVVTGIMIEAGPSVSYRCVWWDGRVRREEWLKECEVIPTGKDGLQAIGFARIKGEE